MKCTALIAAVSLFAATAISTGVAYAAPEPPATTAAPADHERRLPFDRGNANPHQLAQKVRAAYGRDDTGNKLMDPNQCAEDGSCAAIRNYIESINDKDPDAKLTDGRQVADYIDDLVEYTPTAAEYALVYDMDCIRPVGDGQYQTVFNCLPRKLKPGEKIWMTRKTHRFILAGDCTNLLRGIHKEPEPVDITVPKPPVNCYEVSIDNTGQSDVTTDANGDSRIVVHFTASDADYAEMIHSKCFGIVSENHSAANMLHPQEGCGDQCRGGRYPLPALAAAAGLVEYLPNRTLSFPCEMKKCIHFFPKGSVVKITDLTYCVDVRPYLVKIHGHYLETATARFNRVYPDQIAATAPSGKLDRTLHGENHFLPIATGERAQ